MSEQTPKPEDITPDATTVAEKPSPARKTGSAGTLSRVGITQIALVVLAVIFLWQWQAGQHAISDMQQQLAKKIADMEVRW